MRDLPIQTCHDAPGGLDGEPAGAQQGQILALGQRVDREDVEELVVTDVVAVVDGDPLRGGGTSEQGFAAVLRLQNEIWALMWLLGTVKPRFHKSSRNLGPILIPIFVLSSVA